MFCLTAALAFSNSFIVFFDFRFSVWLLHDFYLSVKLFVFFLVCFPDFVKWSFWVFFLVHWTSFKQLFLIFSKQITDILFFFLSWLLDKYCVPLVVSCFFGLLYFWKSCIADFAFEQIVISSSLYWQALEEKEKYG